MIRELPDLAATERLALELSLVARPGMVILLSGLVPARFLYTRLDLRGFPRQTLPLGSNVHLGFFL